MASPFTRQELEGTLKSLKEDKAHSDSSYKDMGNLGVKVGLRCHFNKCGGGQWPV